ncbi:MAG: hypothetical protein HYZ94_00390 [Candidatus Omnitrophica bacterium]|nr:hypothetical protein [Candidatus Omnitrophota bacterium]
MAKRYVLILLALLSLGAVLFGGEELARAALQQALSRAFQVPVSIRRLSFSTRDITLHGVSLSASRSAAASAPVAIRRVRIEGSPFSTLGRRLFTRSWKEETQETLTVTGLTLLIGGVPLHSDGRVTVTAGPDRPAGCEGRLTLDHPVVRGEIDISGRALHPVVYGWIEGAGAVRRRFISQFHLSAEGVGLDRMEIQGGWTAEGWVSMPGAGSGWKGDLHVSGPEGRRYELRLEPLSGKRLRLAAQLFREGAPPKKVSVVWKVRRSRLELDADLLGEEAKLTGVVELNPPHKLDMKLQFRQLDVQEMLECYFPGVVSSPVSGRVEGQVTLGGFTQRPVSAGELLSREGSMGPMKFDSMRLRFEGQGPLLHIHDSQIVKPKGVVSMEGTVDLRKIGQQDFFRHVRLNSTEPGVDLLGLEMSVTKDGSGGIQLGREISPQEQVNLRVQGEEEILSVEHRRKF